MGLFDRLRGGDGPRVAFFGIDGVPYSLVRDNPDTFENLNAIADEGSGGAIDSIVPPESSACWPALTTGVNPGETGVYGFQDREVGSYDTYVPMGRDVRAKRLWSRVTDAGREATVMNVPVTFPPDRDVQRMVSGFLSPGVDEAAYPNDLRETLKSLEYRIDVNAKLGHDENKAAFVEDAHETLEARFEAFKQYVENDDWDLFFGVFMTTDRVNHFLFEHYEENGEYAEEFLEFYAKVDEYLGRLRGLLGDETTMVVASDHGFTTLDHEVKCNLWLEENGWLSYRDRYDIYLNRWLAEEGYLELPAGRRPGIEDLGPETRAYSPEPGRIVVNTADTEAPGAVDDAGALLSELRASLEGLTAPDGTELVASVETTGEPAADEDATGAPAGAVALPGLTLESTTTEGRNVFFHDDLDGGDWLKRGHSELKDVTSDTRAYSLIPGRFYVNLEGREPRGSVPQEEYESVRSELKAELEALEGPDGRKVADRVVTGEAFRGAHDDIAPDLVVVPNHGFDLKSGFKGGDAVFDVGPRNGMHSFDNACLFVDDDSARIADADLYDIAPTLLDLLEVEVDRGEFDGASLV